MKTFLTLFVLLFSSSVLSQIIIIDCGKDVSWKIKTDGTISDKRKEYDYEWRVHENLFLANKNEKQIVIGVKKPKGNINRLLFSLPNKSGYITTAFGYSSNSNEEADIDLGYCNYSKD